MIANGNFGFAQINEDKRLHFLISIILKENLWSKAIDIAEYSINVSCQW